MFGRRYYSFPRSGKRYWRYTSQRYGIGKYVRKSAAISKATKTGKKLTTFSCSVNGYVPYVIQNGEYRSAVQSFVPYVGAWTWSANNASHMVNDGYAFHGGAINDRNFRMMCHTYDQVRLLSMKIKVNPASVLPGNCSFKFHSIVDRSCQSNEAGINWTNFGSTNPTAMTDEGPPSAVAICGSPNDVCTAFNGNRAASIVRSIYPSDMKEKTEYVDAGIMYCKNASIRPTAGMGLEAWRTTTMDFCPCFWTCLESSAPAAAVSPATSVTVIFSYTVEYSFVFRNPKDDLLQFIKMEQPGYVNPAGAKASLIEIKEEKEEDEDILDVEDDPGTS